MLYFFCELATRGFSLTPRHYQQSSATTNATICGTRSSELPPANWPFHVALFYTLTPYRKYYLCGGTIVGERTIITAAHCVVGQGAAETMNQTMLTVQAGVFELEGNVNANVTSYNVTGITLHPEYDMKNLRNDVAVLKVSGPIEFNDRIQPACLWPAENASIRGIENIVGTAVGWGIDNTEQFSNILKESTHRLVSVKRCRKYLPGILDRYNETILCARTGVCSGSGGSGLYVRQDDQFYLRGIVAFGPATGRNKRCGIDTVTAFVNIAFYTEWINEMMSED
ncbi:hypothetical protein RP20_CCG028113 [Aedes albopictus]|nr:hypothetical protein RP20_CCG028113 [Aedes albopictus]